MCQCNHLTNFSLGLVKPSSQPQSKSAFPAVTVAVVVCVIVGSLLLGAVIGVIVMKKWKRDEYKSDLALQNIEVPSLLTLQ